MVRWFVVFGVVTVVLVALFTGIASIVTESPITSNIANIATTVVTAMVTLAVILQWQFPQQQAPQPLSSKWLKVASAYVVFLLFLGIGTDTFLFIRFHPDNSFASIVVGKQIVNTDFGIQWDDGNKDAGSCSPNSETQSYDMVAWPQMRHSSTPQPGGIYACFLTSNFTLAGNMALQVNVKINNGNEAGVIFKDTNFYTHYLYSINITTGAYEFLKDLAKVSTLLDGEPNSAIHTGVYSTNTLALTMIGNTICLYANQTPLHCIQDNQPYGSGTIGLYVGAYPGNVTFSALTVWKL